MKRLGGDKKITGKVNAQTPYYAVQVTPSKIWWNTQSQERKDSSRRMLRSEDRRKRSEELRIDLGVLMDLHLHLEAVDLFLDLLR